MNNTITEIDITPTWSGILPAIIQILQNGNAHNIQIATEELTKMAKLADKQISQIKNKSK